jgi:sugar (pentulose or hexulose) kinase
VRPSGDRISGLAPVVATAIGLPAGLPVFVGLGDNQASFLGSVAQRADSVLVNVGTGGQVAVYTEDFVFTPSLEIRPFPRGGYLLVSAGLSGGAAYALLERFYRQVGQQVLQAPCPAALYPTMNALAAAVPPGADGLQCRPFFTGTRSQPKLRASWSGLSAENFTPGHLTRALLEGMARTFRDGWESIRLACAHPGTQLVGAGNGLRENAVLAGVVAAEFGKPLALARHREEAAYGAALLAAVGAGLFPDLRAAGQLIRYETAG